MPNYCVSIYNYVKNVKRNYINYVLNIDLLQIKLIFLIYIYLHLCLLKIK